MARILLMEDDAEYGQDLAAFLTNNAHSVKLISKGHGLLDEVRSWAPTILILDVFLTKTDNANGSDLAESIRNAEDLQNLPVLFHTAYMTQAMADAAASNRDLPPNWRYLPKSTDLVGLLASIEEALPQHA